MQTSTGKAKTKSGNSKPKGLHTLCGDCKAELEREGKVKEKDYEQRDLPEYLETTVDRDPTIESPIFETRQLFLNLCQVCLPSAAHSYVVITASCSLILLASLRR